MGIAAVPDYFGKIRHSHLVVYISEDNDMGCEPGTVFFGNKDTGKKVECRGKTRADVLKEAAKLYGLDNGFFEDTSDFGAFIGAINNKLTGVAKIGNANYPFMINRDDDVRASVHLETPKDYKPIGEIEFTGIPQPFLFQETEKLVKDYVKRHTEKEGNDVPHAI